MKKNVSALVTPFQDSRKNRVYERNISDSDMYSRRSKIEEVLNQHRSYRRRFYICSKDSVPTRVYYVRSGICIGFDTMADGRRQVVSIYTPGDIINGEALFTGRTSLDVIAMEDAEIAGGTVADLNVVVSSDEGLRASIINAIVRRSIILEAWVAALGRKSAKERMAMLFCELVMRLKVSNEGKERSCTVPFNQHDLADILGMSVVHVNRVLRAMREQNLATFDQGRIEIHDFARLAAIAEFNGAHLR